ncbi:MAG: hypothetical protein ACREE4_03140 [Stellaceae bacterium]
MKNLLLAALVAMALAGCASHNTVPLPTVKASDPVWGLVPDHLPAGMLPQ